eukprot:scaffold1220_cov94-Cylindrotheca_fusiformis.AAC.1
MNRDIMPVRISAGRNGGAGGRGRGRGRGGTPTMPLQIDARTGTGGRGHGRGGTAWGIGCRNGTAGRGNTGQGRASITLPAPPPSPWKKSRAKAKLAMRLENPDDEIYTKKLKPSAVQHSDPLFLLYPPTNFASNLRSLKKKIVDLREAVNFDQAAFEKEKKLHP